tara:strand:+ start:254 stop:736 length:483 start_codon:yes stop_codon:yes gene_type:complete
MISNLELITRFFKKQIMGYKMKGFSGFKESPIKGKGDNLKRIMAEKKAIAKQTGTYYAPGAEPKVKVPNVKGFNVTGSSASTTPGYASTKIAKDLVSKKPSGNIAQAFKTTAGKVLGGLGVAATLYDMYKSGQEHSGGKAVKGQETGVVTPKTSIWNNKK